MIARTCMFAAAVLLVGCGSNSGDGRSLHHPDLSLAYLARIGDANSAVFTSYNPNGPVRWNQGWPWKFDLTGIGWDQTTTVTAITPRHVVMAKHYQRAAGKTAVFHDRDGRPHKRTILKTLPAISDVAVGLLDRPLPRSIRSYPLVETNTTEANRLVGAQVLVTDQKRHLYFHRISAIYETGIAFRYDPLLSDAKKKPLVTGDSGNPSFLLTHGELALIETHTTGGSGRGPFYGGPKMIEAIRKVVAELDSGYQLKTVKIDTKVLSDAETARQSTPQPAPKLIRTPPSSHSSPNDPSAGSTRPPRPRVVVPAEAPNP